jgi:hypothetical protein
MSLVHFGHEHYSQFGLKLFRKTLIPGFREGGDASFVDAGTFSHVYSWILECYYLSSQSLYWPPSIFCFVSK